MAAMTCGTHSPFGSSAVRHANCSIAWCSSCRRELPLRPAANDLAGAVEPSCLAGVCSKDHWPHDTVGKRPAIPVGVVGLTR